MKGDGGMSINVTGICLNHSVPAGEVELDIFLQTSTEEGFFVFAKNLDLREMASRDGTNLDDWPDCEETLSL